MKIPDDDDDGDEDNASAAGAQTIFGEKTVNNTYSQSFTSLSCRKFQLYY